MRIFSLWIENIYEDFGNNSLMTKWQNFHVVNGHEVFSTLRGHT